VPVALDLPVRAHGLLHLGDRLTLTGWAQVEWSALTSDARQDGASSLGFVDALQAGAAVIVGRRTAANGASVMRLTVGGLYQEMNGVRIVSIMLGFGQAHDPWNQ
jgi:hypothetical protein